MIFIYLYFTVQCKRKNSVINKNIDSGIEVTRLEYKHQQQWKKKKQKKTLNRHSGKSRNFF